VEIRNLSMWAAQGLVPDFTIVLDLDPVVSRERLLAENKKFDRLETEALEFHQRVRDSYLAMAAAEPERFIVIDATLDRLEIRDRIIERIGSAA
jgi:dTMP kinase